MEDISRFMNMTLKEILSELSKARHPRARYPRALTNRERQKLYQVKKRAEKEGREFDSVEWVRENIE